MDSTSPGLAFEDEGVTVPSTVPSIGIFAFCRRTEDCLWIRKSTFPVKREHRLDPMDLAYLPSSSLKSRSCS
jgi:hypothetical protein